eukprot:275361-Chlamydomonas_euryale.AAC.1
MVQLRELLGQHFASMHGCAWYTSALLGACRGRQPCAASPGRSTWVFHSRVSCDSHSYHTLHATHALVHWPCIMRLTLLRTIRHLTCALLGD